MYMIYDVYRIFLSFFVFDKVCNYIRCPPAIILNYFTTSGFSNTSSAVAASAFAAV